MSSPDERELRDAVVTRLRELLPSARIVHELNCAGQGTNRIDVAAITESAIVGVEIKSKKDVLKRLDDQWKAFSKCCHYLIVAAHEKHFAPYREACWRDDVPPYIDLNHPLFFGKYTKRRHVWRFPRPDPDANHRQIWTFDLRDISEKYPLRSSDMLEMLWANELQAECARYKISAGSRATRGFMIQEMSLLMTGREVRDAVCRQLRGRTFAEADPAIRPVRMQEAML